MEDGLPRVCGFLSLAFRSVALGNVGLTMKGRRSRFPVNGLASILRNI